MGHGGNEPEVVTSSAAGGLLDAAARVGAARDQILARSELGLSETVEVLAAVAVLVDWLPPLFGQLSRVVYRHQLSQAATGGGPVPSAVALPGLTAARLALFEARELAHPLGQALAAAHACLESGVDRQQVGG
jgi:hypothetical protein